MAHIQNHRRWFVSFLLLFSSVLAGMSADYLCFTSAGGTTSIGYTNYGDNAPDIQYSKDEGKTWVVMSPDDNVMIQEGEKVYFRGYNPTGFSHDPFDTYFQSTDYEDRRCTLFHSGGLYVSGNIMSLIDGEGVTTTIPCDYCFANLFSRCYLFSAPDLPATTLKKGCYENLFANCRTLKEAPELPATELEESCYSRMFQNCQNLTQAPELPATTLKKHCYDNMFYGCDSLRQAPALPATELADYCYNGMFSNNSSMVQAPALPATTLKKGCYKEMFQLCRALEQAPELPAMNLADSCYTCMFQNCPSLVKSPELPAMKLVPNCYDRMFSYCTSLSEAPALPSTELAEECYQIMFSGCDNLTIAPELPATELARGCYKLMFANCQNLKHIKVGLMSLDNPVNATEDWVEGIGGDGVFVFPCGSRYNKHGKSEVPLNFDIIGSPVAIFQNPDNSVLYVDTIDCGVVPVYRGMDPPSAGEGTVFLGWDKPLELITEADVYYYTAQYENMSELASDNCMCFKSLQDKAAFSIENVGGNEPNLEYSKNSGVTWTPLRAGEIVFFESANSKIHVRGINPNGFSQKEDVYTQFKTIGSIEVSGSVMSLIDGEGSSTVIPNDYCFTRLFENTTIINTPLLPADSLKEACYDHMFAGCESLFRSADLPAMKMYPSCYRYMFSGCTSLDSMMNLPATELAPYCYAYMFQNCTGLSLIPYELPAMKMEKACYAGMYYGCVLIERAPDLFSTELSDSCYASMFYGCEHLYMMQRLPAQTLKKNCYSRMFCNTHLMSGVKMLAQEMAEGCCEMMFKGCEHMEDAILSCSELKKECFRELFSGCKALSHITVNLYSLDNDVDATLNWVEGVDGPGVIVFLCGSKYDKHGVSEAPENFEIRTSPVIVFLNQDSTVLQVDTIDCETMPEYRGETPTYGVGLEFSGWYPKLRIPKSVETYYYTAQYVEKGSLPAGPWLCFTAEEAGSTFWYTNTDNLPDVQITTDGGATWRALEADEKVILDSVGAKVYIRGTNPNGFSHGGSTNNTHFGMTGRIAASGNVMSLINTDATATDIPCVHCFDSLFAGCEALTKAPELRATTLTEYCYKNMFSHCTNLTRTPDLYAVEMKKGCYYGMFSDCVSLVDVPQIEASFLEEECYAWMFMGCTSLKNAPIFPSYDLARACFQGMFKGCVSLEKAPGLSAPTLCESCFANMFEGCSSLNYIEVSVKSLDNSFDATKNWVDGVDGDGVFVFPCGSRYYKHGISEVPDNFFIKASPIIIFQNPDGEELQRDTINCGKTPKYRGETPTYGEDKIFIGWDKRITAVSEADVYRFTAQYIDKEDNENGDWLCFTAEEADSKVWYVNNAKSSPNLQYSTDGGQTWSSWKVEEKIALKSVGDKLYVRGYNPNGFNFDANLGHSGFAMSGRIAASGNIMSLLDGCGKTLVIPSNNCFQWLFQDCEALTHAPELPATTLTPYCYNNMFNWCTNLVDAPALPATVLTPYCYSSMFSMCTSLANAPALPATEMETQCYERMFQGCTSLTTAPELPSTQLAVACYQDMFSSSGLTKAPALPATKMERSCYQGMFCYCEGLSKAPDLTAMELAPGCYAAMFSGCTNMTKAPELPAMELEQYCYQEMFAGCTTLVSAPELPARQLTNGCYNGMFKYCINLNYIKVGVMSLDNSPMGTSDWVEMVNGFGTFIFPCGSRYNKHGNSAVPIDFSIISSPIVVFQNPDGTELWRDTVGCAQTPEYGGKTPTYDKGLVFSGWDRELTMLPDPDIYYFTAQYKRETPYTELDSVVIACDSFMLDGKSLTENTTWTDTVADDQLVINYHLLLSHSTERDSFLSACESFSHKGISYSENAEWSDTMLSLYGCDSIITYHLTIHKGVTVDSSIVAEESFTWKDSTYTQNTSWSETLQTVYGCDSVINYHLEITGTTPDPAIITNKDTSACDLLVFKGVTYTKNTTWNDTLQTASGGDSVVIYHLTIHKEVTVDSSIVADDSFTWKEITYTKDASWNDTLQTIYGCDSIVRYSLTVNREKQELQLTVRDEMILILPGGSSQVGYELTGGEGSKYEVRHNNHTLGSGDVTNDSTIALTCPASLEPGVYTATLTMYDDEGEKAEKEFSFNVMLPDNKQKSYYAKAWNDVVICKNGDGQFLSFQWYKDGKKCENASLQYFNDVTQLDGEYMVYVSDKAGKSYFIEPITYEAVEATYAITATPNVVKMDEEFTVKVTGVEPDNLQNARIVVYNAKGVVEKIIDEVKEETVMRMRAGEFVFVLTVNDGKNANCKVLVK